MITEKDRLTARQALRTALTADFDPGDPWGWAIGHMFDVCELMTLLGMPVPDEYDFTPAMGLEWPEDDDPSSLADLVAEWDAMEGAYGSACAADAVWHWARVLDRYLGLPGVRATRY